MRRILFLASLVFALAALGDEHVEKRRLVSELLEVIDAKALMEDSFDAFLNTLLVVFGESPEVPEEERAVWEDASKREQARKRAFQEQLIRSIDSPKYLDEVYAPVFEETFTTDELREMIAFFKTKPGQKLAKALPRLHFGADEKGISLFREATDAAQKELTKEDHAKHPWKATLAQIRELGTAVESRATDVNEYPRVAFEQLEQVIAPTYIRDMPKADSWGTPYLYISDGQHYRIVSAGADRRFEWSSRHLDLNTEATFTDDPDDDIIFQDGMFLQQPDPRTP